MSARASSKELAVICLATLENTRIIISDHHRLKVVGCPFCADRDDSA
jgi:hypothetical protein